LSGRKIDLLIQFSMKNYLSNIGGFRSNKQDGIFLCKKYTRDQQKAENSFIKTRYRALLPVRGLACLVLKDMPTPFVPRAGCMQHTLGVSEHLFFNVDRTHDEACFL
jgi:hypothetical protein